MKYAPLTDDSPSAQSRGTHSYSFLPFTIHIGFATHEGWNGKIKKITAETYIGEYNVTKQHSSHHHICDTKWSGKLAHEIT